MLAFTVYGTAVPQGSTKAFLPKGWTRPIVTTDNAKLKPWRQAIVDACLPKLEGKEPLDCPVELVVLFYLPRPASAPKRVTEPAKLPDLDKLVRAVGDALTAAGVWRDDGRVVWISARKAFAGGARDPLGAAGTPRTSIVVREVEVARPVVQAQQTGLFAANGAA